MRSRTPASSAWSARAAWARHAWLFERRRTSDGASPHGAWWVDLAEIRDAALVPGAVVGALDLRDQASAEPLQILSSYLRDRELLLVFDNCEHVLDASAALVADVLRAAPDVRVIATSREPLQVAGRTRRPGGAAGAPARWETSNRSHGFSRTKP